MRKCIIIVQYVNSELKSSVSPLVDQGSPDNIFVFDARPYTPILPVGDPRNIDDNRSRYTVPTVDKLKINADNFIEIDITENLVFEQNFVFFTGVDWGFTAQPAGVDNFSRIAFRMILRAADGTDSDIIIPVDKNGMYVPGFVFVSRYYQIPKAILSAIGDFKFPAIGI